MRSVYHLIVYKVLKLCAWIEYIISFKVLLLLLSCSVVSNSLRPHGLQHSRLPCPSPTPGTCSNSCPSSCWCHPTISHSIIPLSCLHCFPASGSFSMILLIFLSIGVFSNETVLCIRWPKYWSFSFSISPPNEYSGLISFRIDWFDLLEVQGTLKSLLQHHSWKSSVLQCSALVLENSSWKNYLLHRPTFAVRKVVEYPHLTEWTRLA